MVTWPKEADVQLPSHKPRTKQCVDEAEQWGRKAWTKQCMCLWKLDLSWQEYWPIQFLNVVFFREVNRTMTNTVSQCLAFERSEPFFPLTEPWHSWTIPSGLSRGSRWRAGTWGVQRSLKQVWSSFIKYIPNYRWWTTGELPSFKRRPQSTETARLSPESWKKTLWSDKSRSCPMNVKPHP